MAILLTMVPPEKEDLPNKKKLWKSEQTNCIIFLPFEVGQKVVFCQRKKNHQNKYKILACNLVMLILHSFRSSGDDNVIEK